MGVNAVMLVEHQALVTLENQMILARQAFLQPSQPVAGGGGPALGQVGIKVQAVALGGKAAGEVVAGG